MPKKILIALVISLFIGLPVIGFLAITLNSYSRSNFATETFDSARPQAMRSMPGVALDVAETTNPMRQGGGTVGMSYDAKSPLLPPDGGSGGFTTGVDRTVIRTAHMAVQVEDTRQTVSKVNQIVSGVQGVVTSSNIYEMPPQGGVVNASMALRVPSAQLESVIEQLKALSVKVLTETITAQDRTEQKVDLDAQIENLQATEQQLITIMGKATTVDQTLQVQRELTNVRGQIERLEAQVENLVGDAEMATITLEISTKESSLPVVNPGRKSVMEEVRLAVRDAVSLYRDLFVAGVRLAILGLPLLLIALVAALLWRRRKPKTPTG